ncbi:cysteine desulfurase family protein [Clostridium vitabionis]|uniref:cysteine desulfurase family protein n=1 Tax=Clostridium vitabionis TaxID=2784388 RepID=UPI00188DB8F3|nr:cysteine desulfurase family protein [Clostridium vitabionis]
MIYADNAATTKLCKQAFDAMKPYLLEQYGNASQPYSFSRTVKKALQLARKTIADCIGASPEEIYFTSGGTESDNWALKSAIFLKKEKNEVITSEIEHHAILNSCRTIQRLGIPVHYLSVSRKGIVSQEDLDKATSDKTAIVSIMYGNNEIGTIEPIAELAKIVHAHGALFHTDAVQAVGHIPINVHKENIDLLSSSAHKFNGPKGIGFLYIRNGVHIHPYEDGGSQENGLRAGTENIASIVGMSEALRFNTARMKDVANKLQSLEDVLLNKLRESNIDFIRNGSEYHLPGNVCLSFRGADGEMLLHRLDLMGICISTGSACDSVHTQVSHVIKAIGVPADYAQGTIRITFGAENTISEAVEIANALRKILI